LGATIPVGKNPTDLKINRANTRAYVANDGSASVSVIDTKTRRVIKTILTPAHPRAIAVNRAGTRVYVKSGIAANNGTVTVINAATNTAISEFTVAAFTGAIEVSKDGSRLYVGRLFGLSVLDAVTGKSVAELNLPANPEGLILNEAGTRLYSSSQDGSTGDIEVIDTTKNTLAAKIHTSFTPGGIALDATGARLYVSKGGWNSFAVIATATNTIAKNVPYVGSFPVDNDLVMDPAGQHIYTKATGYAPMRRESFTQINVADPVSGKASMLLTLAGSAGHLVVAPDASAIYAPLHDHNAVAVIALHQLKGLTTAPVPTISGRPARGQRLTANAGTWRPAGVTLRYQWLRSGQVIPGATGSTYVPTTADIGKTINVRILGSKAGYVSLYRYSAHTKAVAAR
jgi:YVTN family beta-propeller protein